MEVQHLHKLKIVATSLLAQQRTPSSIFHKFNYNSVTRCERRELNSGTHSVSQIQNNIARGGLPCATNTLQLIRNDEVSGSKAVFYRTGLPSDGTSHSDSEARSIIASETFPVNGEDPYTLLKPLSKNQGGSLSSNEVSYH